MNELIDRLLGTLRPLTSAARTSIRDDATVKDPGSETRCLRSITTYENIAKLTRARVI